MRDVYVRHHEDVIADNGAHPTCFGAAMNRGELADGVVVANLESCGLAVKFQIGGCGADYREWKDSIALADRGEGFDDDARTDYGAGADFHLRPDYRAMLLAVELEAGLTEAGAHVIGVASTTLADVRSTFCSRRESSSRSASPT